MGVIYYVACETCKVLRYLDKAGIMFGHQPSDRAEAEQDAVYISAMPFRPALLVGFMGEHKSHTCRILDDVNDLDELVNGEYKDYRREKHFWENEHDA